MLQNLEVQDLVYLECVDPAAWSRNSPDIPAVLEAMEVEHVMQLLGSADALIRRTRRCA